MIMTLLVSDFHLDKGVRLATPSVADVAHVCRLMRPDDVAEVFAARYDDSWTNLAFDYEAMRPQATCFYAAFGQGRTKPAAIFGAWESHPGAGQVHLIATKRWRDVALPVTRFIKNVMVPCLMEAGWRRAECRALATNQTARRWLYYLGAREEALLEGYGRAGEDFVQVSWDRKHVYLSQAKGRADRRPKYRGL
jgi:hypothetical protein